MSRREQNRNEIDIYQKLTFNGWTEYLLDKHPELKFSGVSDKDLEAELQKCLEVENFELAAKIRDLIKEYHTHKAIHDQTQQDEFNTRAKNL